MKKYKLFLFAALLGMVFSACQYEFIPAPVVEEITDELSFESDILPIFSSGSQPCIQCHSTGGQSPDWSAANAYWSLLNNIDETNPEQSHIIEHVGPNSTSHTQRHLSANDVNLIETWIEQGAQNN